MGQENDVPPEWKDRVLYVYLRGGGGESLQTGIALSNASFTRIKDQLFLSGRALSDPSDWVAELPLLILW